LVKLSSGINFDKSQRIKRQQYERIEQHRTQLLTTRLDILIFNSFLFCVHVRQITPTQIELSTDI